jgi:hypothetical protein
MSLDLYCHHFFHGQSKGQPNQGGWQAEVMDSS